MVTTVWSYRGSWVNGGRHCMSQKINLEFITTAAKQGNTYSINGIPEKVWAMFMQVSEEIAPEKGKEAWFHLITEWITSHLDQKELSTFMMTNIPTEARIELDTTCREAGMSTDAVIAAMFLSAMKGSFHLINMGQGPSRDEEATETIIVTGMNKATWDRWSQVSEQFNITPEQFVGLIFHGVTSGDVQMVKQVQGEIPTDAEMQEVIASHEKAKRLHDDLNRR